MEQTNSKKDKKVELPDWMGRLPFPPEEKKPVVITHDMEVSAVYIYGTPPHQTKIQKYISTDKITIGDFVIQPGGRFEPPGYHPGPEFYYILEGVATVFNPETGDIYQVKKDETFLICKNTWHQVFNFASSQVKILSIAPVLYSSEEKTTGVKLLPTPKFYKSGLELKGDWPPDKEVSSARDGMLHIPPEKFLHLIHGEKDHVLIALFASKQSLHAGLITISVDSSSENEIHPGDEVIYVLTGTLVVNITTEDSPPASYTIKPGEKFLIPEKTRHQYFNFDDTLVTAIFAVAPKL